jgi:hypothetical protein
LLSLKAYEGVYPIKLLREAFPKWMMNTWRIWVGTEEKLKSEEALTFWKIILDLGQGEWLLKLMG